jgi:hypothetical protein
LERTSPRLSDGIRRAQPSGAKRLDNATSAFRVAVLDIPADRSGDGETHHR